VQHINYRNVERGFKNQKAVPWHHQREGRQLQAYCSHSTTPTSELTFSSQRCARPMVRVWRCRLAFHNTHDLKDPILSLSKDVCVGLGVGTKGMASVVILLTLSPQLPTDVYVVCYSIKRIGHSWSFCPSWLRWLVRGASLKRMSVPLLGRRRCTHISKPREIRAPYHDCTGGFQEFRISLPPLASFSELRGQKGRLQHMHYAYRAPVGLWLQHPADFDLCGTTHVNLAIDVV